MLTNCCRICLTSAGVVHELDEVVHKSLSLYAILCKMYPESFTDNNEPLWPTRVCGICKQAVLDAYELFKVCTATFVVLKNQFKNKSHKWNQSRADMSCSDQSFTVANSDALDFCNAESITIKCEDDNSFLTSGEEEIIGSTEESINADKDVHSNVSIFCNAQQANVEEEKDIVPPQIAEKIKSMNEVATYCNREVIELSIEMDYVAPNNTIPIEEEHLEDFEENMECLYQSTYQENDEYQNENPVLESAVAVQGVSETEREETYAKKNSTKLLSCEPCQDVFVGKDSHEKHIEKHSKRLHIYCKMCGEGVDSATGLNSHKCKDDSSALCWICGVLLDTREKHKSHMQDHVRERTWACQLCPVRFSSEGALKDHLRKHQKDKGHYCNVCGARLYSKRNLTYHQRAVHGGGVEKVYSCTLCDRRFSLPYMLKTHMNSHTGVRPYSCVYCNRVYGCGGDLVEHVAKHHIGNDNIYQCHLCDADFPKIRELKAHYEVHYSNGEKFYNEILTEFGKFRFTTMDLLKMRHQKETAQLGNSNALNRVSGRHNKA